MEVEGRTVGSVGGANAGAPGAESAGSIRPQHLLLLVGIGAEDDEAVLEPMARKILNLRILSDEQDKMNRSLLERGGEVLAVSQFTLYADCRRGRRPSFTGAAGPERGNELFKKFVEAMRREGVRVETGEFGAMMDVHLVNDGPVTIWLDSDEALPAG